MNKLQQIVKKAKELRKQNPKKYAKWTDYIKAASKQISGLDRVTKSGNKTAVHYTRTTPAKKKAVPKKSVQTSLFGTGKKSANHKDRNSHNVNVRVVSGAVKMSGVEPHEAKYYISYSYRSVTQRKYYKTLPRKEAYKGSDGGYYMQVLSDKGTILTPIINVKTGKQAKN